MVELNKSTLPRSRQHLRRSGSSLFSRHVPLVGVVLILVLSVCTYFIASYNSGSGNSSSHRLGDHTGTESGCYDTDDNCPDWAEQGECKANPKLMARACKRSCGYCKSDSSSMDSQSLSEGENNAYDNVDSATSDKKIPKENIVDVGDKVKDGYDENMTMDKICRLDDTSDECQKLVEESELCRFDHANLMVKCPKSCGRCITEASHFGVEQEIPEEAREKKNTEFYISMSITYMAQIRNSADNADLRMCENKHPSCSSWAARMECTNNPRFMNEHCAAACQTCDLIEFRRRCPMDSPDAIDALESGDLDTMFERIISHPDYIERYNPKVHSRPRPSSAEKAKGAQDGPWVVTFDNLLSDDEVESLINEGKGLGYAGSQEVDPHGMSVGASMFRTSTNTWCQDACKENPSVIAVIDRISEMTGTPVQNSEDLQLLRYEPGQFYVKHHDYIDFHIDKQPGVRILTFFLYLNDVCDEGDCGGGTAFPDLNITVQPKKGSALLWPSVLNEEPNNIDPRTEHEAQAVKKGVKYGANAWIHMRDYQSAKKAKCI